MYQPSLDESNSNVITTVSPSGSVLDSSEGTENDTSCDGAESLKAVEENGSAASQSLRADVQSDADSVVDPAFCELDLSYASNCEENLMSVGSELNNSYNSTEG